MGMREIKDRGKDWPGSSDCKQAPEYISKPYLDVCELGHVTVLLMN